MSRETKIICDRCGKEIVYCGWTTKIKEKRKRPRKFYILKLFNGNPSGYNYSEYDCELCAACSHELKKFLKGAKTVDEQERNAPGE